MSYVPKTTWKYNEILTENDLNRIESGIEAAHLMMDEISGEIADAVRTQRLNFLDLAMEVETIKKAQLTGVSANILVESFVDTNDIIMNGAAKYDATNQKIYLA